MKSKEKIKDNKDKVLNTYYDENGVKVTVYKPQYPRMEEITFPRRKEIIDYFGEKE